jgi:hypothetical protein
MSKSHRRRCFTCVFGFLYAIFGGHAQGASAERIVIIKADGLSFALLEEFVQKRDAYSGKSVLPWIEHVFYLNGTRLSNFYSRGLSISAPSWAILDTGLPSVIKGNLEFDRLTLEAYDYLNMFSYALKNSAGRADTPGMRVLDEQGIRVLSDAFLPSERSLGPQIYLRGLPLPKTAGIKRLLTLQNPKEWFDEWVIGLEGEKLLVEVSEKELLSKLKSPAIRYLDISVPFFDHAAHRNREAEAQLRALQQIDTIVKHIWTGIQDSPLASTTSLILVSDHGVNTDPETYSQGYNLIDVFRSSAGGGHHVLTHRPPLSEYSLKSLSPTVPLITTSSPDSYYLHGQAAEYPTLLLDADGNERASIYLRHSDLNVLHILWQQLQRKDLPSPTRRAATEAFFEVVNRHREGWKQLVSDFSQQQKYNAYLRTLTNLLSLRPEDFESSRVKIETVLPRKSLGQLNSVHDLQNYAIGIGRDSLVLNPDGSLDLANSFVRINYFELMRDLRVRNKPQPSVSLRPVDFITAVIPGEAARMALGEAIAIDKAVWVYKDDENQALIIIRRGRDDGLQLRYVPVRNLKQDRSGRVDFSPSEWRDGLPLAVWESLTLPVEERKAWFDEWHPDVEWFQRLHAGPYSNAVVSLAEHYTFSGAATVLQRKRELAQADFIVFANNHWNFNFRAFNPGGNHGSFFRLSANAILMFAGGRETGIPKGTRIDQPYDSLSFVPTVLLLAGRKNTHALPGPVIRPLFNGLN